MQQTHHFAVLGGLRADCTCTDLCPESRLLISPIVQGLVRHAHVIERAMPLCGEGDAAGGLGSYSPSHSGASLDFNTILASRGPWGEVAAQQVKSNGWLWQPGGAATAK